MEQTIEPVPDAAQRSSPDLAHLSLPAPSPKQQQEMIKPPSPISEPQPRATKHKKKKTFQTLEDADPDYEYDNRDEDLSDLSDLEPLSPAGRLVRKRGRSVSPPPTVTVEEPVRTKRRLVYTFLCSDIPPLFFTTPIFFLKFRGPREFRIRLSLRRLRPRPRRKKFWFRLPQLFRSPQLFRRRPLMGLPRLVRRSASSWFLLVINALLLFASDCVFVIRLAFSPLVLHVLAFLLVSLLGNYKYLLG